MSGERKYPMRVGQVTDAPMPGQCKLRIKSDGTYLGTHVVAVDSEGVELKVLWVTAIDWKGPNPGENAETTLVVMAPEVELDGAVAIREEATS